MNNKVEIILDNDGEMFNVIVNEVSVASGNFWDFRFPDDLDIILTKCGIKCTITESSLDPDYAEDEEDE